MKKVSLDLHDFSILNNRMDLLFQLKEFFPNFKVSMFTIPWDYRQEKNSSQRVYRDEALKKIKENLDWIQIIPHGLIHLENEMKDCDYTTFRHGVIPSIDEVFKKDGLPYEKGFCAPHWTWTPEVCNALDDAGWWGAIDRNQPDMPKTKRTYTYTHSLNEPFWESTEDVLNLHGHIDGVSKNDLERCITGIIKLPPDVEWHYVTDFLK